MSKEHRQQAKALIPLALTIVLTATYGIFAGIYMECRWGVAGCEPINVTSIYLPDSSVINRYPEDKTTPAEALENSLVTAVSERQKVTENRAKTILRGEDLQKQVLDSSTAISRLVATLEPSEHEGNNELKKLEKVSGELQKEKTANDDVLEQLTSSKQVFDETIKNLQDRLEASHKLATERHNRRLTWVLFNGLFLLTCIGSLFVAFLLPFNIYEGNPGRARLLYFLAGSYVAYGLIRLFIDVKFTTIFESIVSIAGQGDAKMPIIMDAIGNTAVFALLITTVIILWHSTSFFTDEPSKFEEKLEQLKLRRKYLRVILYVGTILLVVSTLRSKVLLDWLQTFILQANVRTSAEEFSKVLISFQGVFYTLLLAAVYLPARQIIFDRALKLPISKADAANKQTKLEAAGFVSTTTTPFKDLIPRIAALLAPFLIGPIADLVGKAFG